MQQSPDRPDRLDHGRQPMNRPPIHAAQRRNGYPGGSGHHPPPPRPQPGHTLMARRRERRRQKHQPHPRLPRPHQPSPPMRRTRPSEMPPRPASPLAQVPPCPHRHRPLTRHHERQPPRPTHYGHLAQQRRPPRHPVMPEHHPTQPGRQRPHRAHDVIHPRRIGEQPQRWQPRPAPRLDRASPRDKPMIHDHLRTWPDPR